MIPWRTIIGLLATLGALIGMAWLIHSAGERAGYSGGQDAGYKRGVIDTHALNDARMREFIATSRAETEKTLREASEHVQAIERAREADIAAARQSAAATVATAVADRDRLLARVRADKADASVHPAGTGARLPEVASVGTGLAVPAGPLHVIDRESLVRLGYDAEWVNAQYRICYRYAQAVTAKQQ